MNELTSQCCFVFFFEDIHWYVAINPSSPVVGDGHLFNLHLVTYLHLPVWQHASLLAQCYWTIRPMVSTNLLARKILFSVMWLLCYTKCPLKKNFWQCYTTCVLELTINMHKFIHNTVLRRQSLTQADRFPNWYWKFKSVHDLFPIANCSSHLTANVPSLALQLFFLSFFYQWVSFLNQNLQCEQGA